MERIHLLNEYIKEDPGNPFNYYALALEYQHTEPNKAVPLFEHLLANHPDYLPTYYTAAMFMADHQQTEQAIEVFQKGIDLASMRNETKTVAELQNALSMLED